MPASSGPLTAVVVSGGKQYRVASGDRILVDRLSAEPGSELVLERVLMVANGDDLKVGSERAGQIVTVRVIGHRRGPKIDVLRYRPKKRVRVHRGARAELTALEVLSIGTAEEAEAARAARARETEQPAPPRRRRTARKAEAASVERAVEEPAEKPAEEPAEEPAEAPARQPVEATAEGKD